MVTLRFVSGLRMILNRAVRREHALVGPTPAAVPRGYLFEGNRGPFPRHRFGTSGEPFAGRGACRRFARFRSRGSTSRGACVRMGTHTIGETHGLRMPRPRLFLPQ